MAYKNDDDGKDGQGIRFNLSARWISVIIAGIGLLIYFFVVSGENKWSFLETIKDVVKTIATTAISIGALSLILELSTIKDTVEKAMKNLLKGNVSLEGYSSESLNKIHLKTACAKSKIKMSESDLTNSVYSLEPCLFNLTQQIYHQSHQVTYIVKPEGNRFYKSIKMKSEIRNPGRLDNIFNIEWGFKEDTGFESDGKKKDRIKISKLLVNGCDRQEEARKLIKIKESKESYEKYPYTIVLELPLPKDETVKIEFSYDYYTDEGDMTQGFKLNKPCKQLMHAVYIEGEEETKWKLSVSAFASFYSMGSVLEDKFVAENTTNNGCKIAFNEWVIPGAGYLVSFNKKV